MKKLFILLGLFVCAYGFGQKVYTDSIDVSLQNQVDSVYFPSLGRINAGNVISVELVYTTLNADDAYAAVGFSNTGTTFNFASSLYGASTDSVLLDVTTNERVVNGAYGDLDPVATGQASIQFTGDGVTGKYFGIYINKGSATTGKIYYYILKL